MNLLLIDYISYYGHRNFNKIHIDALQSMGHFLTMVGKKGQYDNIELGKQDKVLEMPNRFFKNYVFPAITFRLTGIEALLWVKSHIKIKEYDAVIVLTYDILSLFVFRTSVPVFLINHNNVSQLWSKVKLILTKGLPHNYKHIALNMEMEQRLHELLPRRQVFHIPHGLCTPSNEMKRPNFICETEHFLFCPVNRNYNREFVKEILEDPLLSIFLKENKLIFYIKEQFNVNFNEVIKSVPQNLESKEYNYMLKHAIAVILPYGKGFKYRCSGIFFECVSHNTPVITTPLKSMTEYENEVEMKMFSTSQELIDAIRYYQHPCTNARNLTKFEPGRYWKIALSSLCM